MYSIYIIYIAVLLHGYIKDLEGTRREIERWGGGVDPKETIFSPLILYLGEYEVFRQTSTDPGETSEVHKFSFLSRMTELIRIFPSEVVYSLYTHTI